MKTMLNFPTLGIFLGIWGITAAEDKPIDCHDTTCADTTYIAHGHRENYYTTCRRLPPTIRCLKEKVAHCKESDYLHHLQLELHKKKATYTATCRHSRDVAIKCNDFSKCLRPEVQKASHDGDIEKLCRMAPAMIDCFERALAECKKVVGKKNPNIVKLEARLNELERRADARCFADSIHFPAALHSWKSLTQVLALSLLCLVVLAL